MKKLNLVYLQSASHVQELILFHQGRRPVISSAALNAALEICNLDPSHQILQEASEFFRHCAVMVPKGLSSLPSIWLRDLPGLLWNGRKPHWPKLPYMISSLRFEDGVIAMSFAQEIPTPEPRLTTWDKLRMSLNLGVKPNLWTPLDDQLERSIWDRWPKLRKDLFELPS